MELRRRHSLKRLSSKKKHGSQQNTKQEEESQIDGVDSFIEQQLNEQ